MIQGIYEGCKQYGKMYSITVDGNYYGFGPYDPTSKGINVGDEIKFEITKNGKYTNADVNTVEVVSKASAGSSSKSSDQTNASSMNKNDYWEQKAEADAERQTIIEFQSSRNAAIQTLDVLLKNGMVKTPAANKQYDFALDLIEEITQRYNTQLENVRQFGLPTEQAEVETNNASKDELDS